MNLTAAKIDKKAQAKQDKMLEVKLKARKEIAKELAKENKLVTS